jgi:mRNA-degrading endonuclease RelE of RelBE toxin-antitoxin system
MMQDFGQYNPGSSILFLSICSLHKTKGGISNYENKYSLYSQLSPEIGKLLLKRRDEVRNLIWSGKISWGGIGTEELDYNNNLMPGPDFGGDNSLGEYLSAINRYSGRFFLALGEEGKQQLIRSHHHLLLLSGLYGLLSPSEPIQLYSCPLEGESIVQNVWTNSNFLTRVIIDYIKKKNIKRIFDFTARGDYRDLIDWDEIKNKTSCSVLFCFTKMSAYDYALIEFGNVLRQDLLNYTEKELMEIQPETIIGDVIFRQVPFTWDTLPKEKEILLIKNAEKEFPKLPAYSSFEIEDRLFGDISSTVLCDRKIPVILHSPDISPKIYDRQWLVSFTSEFEKNLKTYSDKKLQGRMLEAIVDIVNSPLTRKGDTVKPLSGPLEGKWRYRIGDFRLIYQPDNTTKKVYLIAIRPRGNAYLD